MGRKIRFVQKRTKIFRNENSNCLNVNQWYTKVNGKDNKKVRKHKRKKENKQDKRKNSGVRYTENEKKRLRLFELSWIIDRNKKEFSKSKMKKTKWNGEAWGYDIADIRRILLVIEGIDKSDSADNSLL